MSGQVTRNEAATRARVAIVYAGANYGSPHLIIKRSGSLLTVLHERSGCMTEVHACDIEERREENL